MSAGDELPDPAAGTAGQRDQDLRRNSTLVAAGIALSRLFGVVRDAVLAFFLGANLAADAFGAALRIPNLLQNLLGEGVLSASFIPTYSRLLAEGRDEEAGRVAGAVVGLLTAITGVAVLLGVVLARPLTMLLTPGFSGERLELTVTLVRITFPGIGLLVLSAWCLGVLNSHRRFFLSYVAPVLWNVGIIATMVALAGTAVLDPAVAAGIGVIVGGGAQFAAQLVGVRRLTRGTPGTIRPSLETRSPAVRQVLRAFWPVLAGRGVVQLAALLDLVVASLLAVGAVAVLRYAQALYFLPIGLFGMSVAAAELPVLSTLRREDVAGLRRRLQQGLARTGFFVVGSTVAYLLLARPIVEVLFGRGEFDAATAAQVGLVLSAYALAILPATASRLMQSVLYAADDARTPARIAVLRVGVALLVAVPLMLVLDRVVVDLTTTWSVRVADGERVPTLAPVDVALRAAETNQLRLGAAGLAIGAVVGSWLEYRLLSRAIARHGVEVGIGGGTFGRLLLAAVAAGTGIVLGQRLLGALVADPTALAELLVAGGLGGAAYLATAAALRVPEARVLLGRSRRGG